MMGEPIKGVLHSTDASAGVEVPIFKQGSTTAYTLDADEYIEIHSAQVTAAAAGDLHLFIGDDATPGTGETVLRGTVGTNGGIVQSHLCAVGKPGAKPFVVAASGVVDVVFNGVVRRERGTGRPAWREDETV